MIYSQSFNKKKIQIPNVISIGKSGRGIGFQIKNPDLTSMVKNMDFTHFEVTTCNKKYLYVEDFPLRKLQAKHIIVRNDQTEMIYQEAIDAGHPNIMWGNLRNGTIESEKAIIEKMITDNFQKSIRITITDDHVWSDNNHSTISYIRRGYERVGDVPHYIIDCRVFPCRLIGTKDNIIWDHDAIQTAIQRAYRLQLFEQCGGRRTSWTIDELMKQTYQEII